jgi:tetratricopeptide (TPR) repeat protein
MTDPKKPGPIEDIDWDEALAEWEGKTLDPEVAAEIPPDGAIPERPSSRRLYRPPSVPPPALTAPPKVPRPAPPIRRIEKIRRVDPEPPTTSHKNLAPRETPQNDPPATSSRDALVPDLRVEEHFDPFPAMRSQELTLPAPEESFEISLPETLESLPPEDAVDAHESAKGADEPLPPMRGWDDERPAALWLDEAARASLEGRVEWLEQEARLRADKTTRARGLLVCSELLATLGRREQAYTLAVEARDLAPSLVLSHRQARALMPWPPDPDDHLEALDAEARTGPPGPARLHSMLLAVDALRMTGNDRAAGARVDDAFRVAPGDSRVAVALAIRALSASGAAGSVSRLPDAPQVVAIAQATASCLQLRGHDIKVATDPSVSPNVRLLRARQALDRGDLDGAIESIAELARVPELTVGAQWLAAALAATSGSQRRRASEWLSDLLERGQEEALRPLLARAIELGDSDLLAKRLAASDTLTSAERVALAALANRPDRGDDADLDAASALEGMRSLISAVEAIAATSDSERSDRGVSAPSARAEVALGRALGASAPSEIVEKALREVPSDRPPAALGVALENATRAGRFDDVSRILEAWGTSRGSDSERATGAHTAALVALRAGTETRALEAFSVARSIDPGCEATLRAIAALQPTDLAVELSALADEWGEGVRAALARIEAAERTRGVLDDAARLQMLERAHEAAPSLPIASFLAGRLARKGGNLEQALAWTRKRRTAAVDPAEAALEAVREALLVGPREPKVAAECLLEAHVAHPMDVGLRELYERFASDAPSDRAAWMEQRLAQTSGNARTVLALEAAREYEGTSDTEGALRCASAADESSSIARIARERAELGAGQFARLADQLLMSVKGGAGDAIAQREAYERLAVLDATVRQDAGSALLWHRSILDEHPEHTPSLRYVEQYLIGEGRDDELESVTAAIARSLRGTGAGECTSHAELAARLRGRTTSVEYPLSARDMLEIAFSEGEPSLWAARSMAAQARADGDDATLLLALKILADRATRPADAATLLCRAAEAALRYGDTDQARTLLERAAGQDVGDAQTWSLLAELRMRLGDGAGAADAFEAVARSSGVARRQLAAWYEAGRLWADIVGDDLRAISAFEAVSALDVAHADVSERLGALYAAREMHAELADLLEHQIARATDPERRLALEVRRGRALLAIGDFVRARLAFEGALEVRPDYGDALSSLADLCIDQSDWEAAEQALIRLARLLPSPEEQLRVYVRLSELYSHHLLNLSRAEVALKEILKRAPDDLDSAQKLIEVYKRQNDPTRAVELQQELVAKAQEPGMRRNRMLELASLQEREARDPRRAERTLEAVRREFPHDLGLLRELVEFYQRHQQAPAVKILLDRAAADARRALAGGQMSANLFEILATVFDLRGKKDGARVARGILAALEARSVDIGGAGDRALNPQLDEWLAPEPLSSALRAMLANAGDAIDMAAPLNLRDLQATPARPSGAMAQFAARVAGGIGLNGLQVFTSPKLEYSCIPVSSAAPTIIMGDAVAGDERVGPFLVVRALKLVRSRASALVRLPPAELAVLVAAWLKCFNPAWRPQWVVPAALEAAQGRVRAALPRNLDPNLAVLALEVGAAMEQGALPLGTLAIEWADRAALLALGDPGMALQAIAAGAPPPADQPGGRTAWVARTPEALSLASFAVSDLFIQARGRLGLDV